MTTEKKDLIIKNLDTNLSSKFKQWYDFQGQSQSWENDEDIIRVELETMAHMILHSQKGSGYVFANDAKYICEYSLTLGFDEDANKSFHKFLASAYYFCNEFDRSLNQIELVKAFLNNEEYFISYIDLEQISVVELDVYKRLDNSTKIDEVSKQINIYRTLYEERKSKSY